MKRETVLARFVHGLRSWVAGMLFRAAGRVDSAYDVWLDDAPRRRP